MATLVEAVERAIARLAIDGINGWGINCPDGWDSVTVSAERGCDSETCGHMSHDPAAPTYRVYPRTGRLVSLGDGGECVYYAHINEMGTTYYHVTQPLYFHARVTAADVADVPEYLLAALAVS